MQLSVSTNMTDDEIEGIRDNIKRYNNATTGPYTVYMTQVEVTCELQAGSDGGVACKG